jgi:hypothetical protein
MALVVSSAAGRRFAQQRAASGRPFRLEAPIGSAWERLCQDEMTVASDLRRAVEQLAARERPAGLPTSSGE